MAIIIMMIITTVSIVIAIIIFSIIFIIIIIIAMLPMMMCIICGCKQQSQKGYRLASGHTMLPGLILGCSSVACRAHTLLRYGDSWCSIPGRTGSPALLGAAQLQLVGAWLMDAKHYITGGLQAVKPLSCRGCCFFCSTIYVVYCMTYIQIFSLYTMCSIFSLYNTYYILHVMFGGLLVPTGQIRHRRSAGVKQLATYGVQASVMHCRQRVMTALGVVQSIQIMTSANKVTLHSGDC